MELENERHARIFVDADACPVIKIVESVAEKYRLPVTLLCEQTMYWNLPIVP